MLDLPEELGDSDSDGSAKLTAPGKHTKSAADQLKFAQTINNTLFEDPYSEKKSKKRSKDRRPPEVSPYDFKCKFIILILTIVGSVPYGLPCIAQTRRTLDMTLKNKQIELINEKLCRIMRQPSEYAQQ